MTAHRLLLAACFLALTLSAQNPPLYQNSAAPLDQRVNDLVSRMTLEEKISQMMNDAPAIERLGIPAYNWWNECLHGVARAGKATVFPEPIGLAATWDARLVGTMANAISDEARAKHHEFLRRGKHNIYQGLTFWSPNINIFRDPRWGRGMETYGEDPYLTGRMAVEFIRGLQGDDPKYLKVVATAKHFAVHSGPESERHVFDARVDGTDLFGTYLPQFEAAVRDGGADSVMCSYNRVDGLPACASPRLLGDILRERWKFGGYVVSDCGAVGDIYRTHKTAASAPEGAARAVLAGTDLDCGTEYRALLPAVQQKLLPEEAITNAVRRLFTARFRLGMFDPPDAVPYARIPYDVVESSEHKDLALDAARESIVLLKNETLSNGAPLLPLSKDTKTIAVIGPNANDIDVMLGNYNGEPTQPMTPLDGIKLRVSRHTTVLYARGCDIAANLPAMQVVPNTALYTTNNKRREAGLKGQYFNRADFNTAHLVKPLFTRIDRHIDFHWADAAPRDDMDDDNFGVRWTGYVAPPVSGAYRLGAIGLNGFEVYLDGRKIAARSNIHERGYSTAPVQLEAGKLYALRVDFHETVNDADIHLVWAPPDPGLEQEALTAARQADAVVLVMGLSPRLEGEEMDVPVEGFAGGDRVTLDLPKVQQDLMQKIVAVGKPTVLVLLNGSALGVNWARDHVPAILETWYPGQTGGAAIADVLFGDYNPAGRLPVTFYQSAQQLPPFSDYAMKGRTYRYFEGQPLYPFGYGLSYTTFLYRNLQVAPEVSAGNAVRVSADVLNSGKMAGEEVVELYVRRPGAMPIRSLAGFVRTRLQPGERKTVDFQIAPAQLATVGADGTRTVNPGDVEISFGGKQPGFEGAANAATTEVLTRVVKLTGAAVVLQ